MTAPPDPPGIPTGRLSDGPATPRRSAAFGPREAIAVLAAYIVAQMVVGVFSGMAAAVVLGESAAGLGARGRLHPLMPLLIVVTALAGAVTAVSVSYVLICVRGGETFRDAIGWRLGSRAQLLLGAIAGCTLAATYLVGAYALFPVQDDIEWGPLVQMSQTPGPPQLVWALLGIGLAPPLEEFLFRGVVYSGLARRWGTWGGATLTTLFFCVMHIPEVQHYWPGIIGILLLAVLAIRLRISTGTIGPSIALHATYNGTITALVLLSTRPG